MLRRVASYLVVCLLLFSLCAFSGNAEKTPILTVANEYIFPLSDSTMPIYKDGSYYVPASVFKEGFGASVISNTVFDTLTISNGGKTVTFDLFAGLAYNQDSQSFRAACVYKDGVYFVPAEFLCGQFGYRWSYIQSLPGVRIRSSGSNLSDSGFLSAYKTQIESALDKYLGNPEDPSTPGENPTETPVEPRSPVKVVLSFDLAENVGASEVLDVLSEKNIKAIFFVPPDAIGKNNEILRRALLEGHRLGYILPEGLNNSEEIAKVLDDSSPELEKYGLGPVFLCKSASDGRGISSALLNYGYVYFSPDVNVKLSSAKALKTARQEIATAYEKKNRIAVSFAVSEGTNDALSGVVDFIESGNYSLSPPGLPLICVPGVWF